MKPLLLTASEMGMVQSVFRRHLGVASATVFGSRAKGTQTEWSDVDFAVTGNVDPLHVEAIAAELDELPLPYRFEVQFLEHIRQRPLLEHIQRAGILVYSASSPQHGISASRLEP